MKDRHSGGFSLIEVLAAIVLLAIIVIPISSSMVLSHRMNEKTEALMQAQMDVSSAVEYLMANGYSEDTAAIVKHKYDVEISASALATSPWCQLEITSGGITVTTSVRVVSAGGGT